MVKILKNQKHVFWQALIVALIFFNIGIYLGYMLEKSRGEMIDEMYFNSELELMNVKIFSDMIDSGNINCEDAIQANINFADQIFGEALVIRDFEESNEFTSFIILQHKKFDLLRTLVWINSIKLKQRCNATYHNVIYLYEYADGDPSPAQKSKQEVFSKVLAELKREKGDDILLVPIAADVGFSSIELLKETYGIDELPVVLIDETHKITEISALEDLEQFLE